MRNGTGSPLTGYNELAERRGVSKATAGKYLRKMQDLGYISMVAFSGTYGTAIYLKQWLQFVVKNRRGEVSSDAVDMHIEPVADDNVYRSIRLFETGVLEAEETVKRLKTEVLQDQWTFHTENVLSFLKFVESIEIRTEE